MLSLGSMESQKGCELLQLPALALQRVFCRLEARQLAFLCCTCQELNKVCSETSLWERLSLQRWKQQQTELWRKYAPSSEFKTLYGAKDKVRHMTCSKQHRPSTLLRKMTYSKSYYVTGGQASKSTCG